MGTPIHPHQRGLSVSAFIRKEPTSKLVLKLAETGQPMEEEPATRGPSPSGPASLYLAHDPVSFVLKHECG